MQGYQRTDERVAQSVFLAVIDHSVARVLDVVDAVVLPIFPFVIFDRCVVLLFIILLLCRYRNQEAVERS